MLQLDKVVDHSWWANQTS